MKRSRAQLCDLIDDLLISEQEIPTELVVELLVSLSDTERVKWVETLLRMARSPHDA